MRTRKGAGLLLIIALSVFCFPNFAGALLSDKKAGKWNLMGRIKSQASFRTTDTPDNNQVPIEKGDMTSQRNLLFLDFKHDLGEFNVPTGGLLPDAPLQIEYFLQLRAFYDGVYDYGPDVFSDEETREWYGLSNGDEIDDFKSDVGLFMGYVDLTWSDFFLRLGRQKLAWGEMGFITIVDICPQDNSSLDVDVLERYIPLDMVRANLAFHDVGPIASLSIEGFFVPGKIDNTTGERVPMGTPLIPPTYRNTPDNPDPIGTLVQFSDLIEDDIDSDRFGVKVGSLLGDLELNFMYYRVYSTMLMPTLDLDRMNWDDIDMNQFIEDLLSDPDFDLEDLPAILEGILGDQKLPVIEKYADVETFGTSFNYLINSIDMVVRGEAALFKDVPKLTGGSIPDLFDEILVRSPLEDDLSWVDGEVIAGFLGSDLGEAALPFSISADEIKKYDVWEWGIGLDKNISVDFINSKKEIMLMFEYMQSKIMDWEPETLLLPWNGPNGETLYENEYLTNFSLLARTDYLNGFLTPQILVFYEVEPKAWSFIPSLLLMKGAFMFEISGFFTTAATYDGLKGNLDCKDEIKFAISYSF